MMAKIKAGLVSLRDLFATAWWIVLIAGIGFVVAYQFVEPAPPTKIVITTGSDSGAYYQFANRYAAILARNGITLEVMLNELVAHFGWAELGQRIAIRCFTSDPSVASSLKFLRKTPWARKRVEQMFLAERHSHPD